MKKVLIFILLTGAISYSSYGQSSFSEFTDNPSAFTISSDKNTLQIGGRVAFYYENRFLKTGQTNLDHNGLHQRGKTVSLPRCQQLLSQVIITKQ